MPGVRRRQGGDRDRAADGARELCERTEARFTEPWWDAYALATGAELAVVARLPDAADRLRRATPLGAENDWAAACLARARWRLTGDGAALADAIAGWERLGARFEHTSTLHLRDQAVQA